MAAAESLIGGTATKAQLTDDLGRMRASIREVDDSHLGGILPSNEFGKTARILGNHLDFYIPGVQRGIAPQYNGLRYVERMLEVLEGRMGIESELGSLAQLHETAAAAAAVAT
jgi:hypothetical protein